METVSGVTVLLHYHQDARVYTPTVGLLWSVQLGAGCQRAKCVCGL